MQIDHSPLRQSTRRDFLKQSTAMAVGCGLTPGVCGRDCTAAADGVDSGKLQAAVDFLENECKSGSYPGAGIVASRDGKVFFEHYVGTYHNMLDADAAYHADVRSVFYSYTKGISSTVVMMAQQRGLIDIDAPIAIVIPEFGVNGKEKITIRHVLTHSAGIPSAPNPMMPLRNETEWLAGVEAICKAKLEWEPGSQTGYHGLAMMIAAEVVRRKLDRRTWDSICREWLFDPIGAKSLAFDIPQDKSLVNMAPKGSKGQDGVQELVPGHPAGGCFGTLKDGLRVLELHLNQGKWEDKTLLEESAYQEMHKLQYAQQIADAKSKGQQPKHENWAVGWLLRGEGPAAGGSGWFGFKDQTNPSIFGHAGIDTIIGVADPKKNIALMFNMTRSPKSSEDTVRLRNEATNRVLNAID